MQEDAPQQIEEKMEAALLVERKGSAKAKNASESDDEGSLCGQPTTANAKRTRACAICEVKNSDKWYYCPEGLVESDHKPRPCVMCDSCGVRWRHCEWRRGRRWYERADDDLRADGIQYASSVEDSKSHSGGKSKEPKSKAANDDSPPPTSKGGRTVYPPTKPCLLCKRIEPRSQLAHCDRCSLSAHVCTSPGIWTLSQRLTLTTYSLLRYR